MARQRERKNIFQKDFLKDLGLHAFIIIIQEQVRNNLKNFQFLSPQRIKTLKISYKNTCIVVVFSRTDCITKIATFNSTEEPLKRGTLKAIIPVYSPEWSIKFNFHLKTMKSSFCNVVLFTTTNIADTATYVTAMASKVVVLLKPDLQTPILSSADFMKLCKKTQAKFGLNAITFSDLKKNQ